MPLRLKDEQARTWYANEAATQGWSVRALNRQISALFYERLLGSQAKDKLAHQDVGQMDMYVRVFDEQMRGEGDNPTLGLILCSERDAAVAKYSLLADKSQLFASKY